MRSKLQCYNLLWLALVLMIGLNISSLLTIDRLEGGITTYIEAPHSNLTNSSGISQLEIIRDESLSREFIMLVCLNFYCLNFVIPLLILTFLLSTPL